MRLEKDSGSWFPNDFEHGQNFRHGIGCIIEPDVKIGHNVQLGHRVLLKSGTVIMNDVVLADDCRTTGLCIIGNNVSCRTGTTISKGVIINDWAFLGAAVMTSHTKNVPHGRPITHKQYVTSIGYGCIIGSRTNMKAGVTIEHGVVVAYGSNVLAHLGERHAVYRGNPAVKVGLLERGDKRAIVIPDNYVPWAFPPESLKRYLPHAL